jgi:hypothetical protein
VKHDEKVQIIKARVINQRLVTKKRNQISNKKQIKRGQKPKKTKI